MANPPVTERWVWDGEKYVTTTVRPDMRIFDTGARRDTEDGKPDFEAFLSPLVLSRYAEYMHRHRKLPDGSMRDGDDWQRGIPKSVYVKSAWRHFFAWWTAYRAGWTDLDAACGILFNVMGFMHECLKSKPNITDSTKCQQY